MVELNRIDNDVCGYQDDDGEWGDGTTMLKLMATIMMRAGLHMVHVMILINVITIFDIMDRMSSTDQVIW